MKKVVLALALVMSLGLFGCAGGDHASGSTSRGKIEVSVVDRSYMSVSGYSLDERKVATLYNYDEQGRLVLTEQFNNYNDERSINLSRKYFDYDEAGNLASIMASFEQYDWNVGSGASFSYGPDGRCERCLFEIISQGTGKYETVLEYSDEGNITSGTLTKYQYRTSTEGKTWNVAWSYLPSGKLESAIVRSNPSAGIELSPGLSDVDAGDYAYRDLFTGTLTTLHFDEEDRLVKVETDGRSDHTETIYEYKTIEVDASTYKPTVFSNPTGIDPMWKPTLSDEEVAAIMGKKK